MKTRIILLIGLLLSCSAFGQGKRELTNLAELCRVWGFLKFYHPAVAEGKLNWDNELLKMAEKVRPMSKAEFEKAITEWYNAMPARHLSLKATQPTGDSIIRVFNPHDIKKYKVPSYLRSRLTLLYTNHIPGANVYFTNKYKQYTLDFILATDDVPETSSYPEAPVRMLSFFRYWNTINYFYPHKALIPGGWDAKLEAFLPLFLSARNKEEYQLAFRKLQASMHDSHSFFNEPHLDSLAQYRAPFGLKRIKGHYYIDYLFKNPITIAEDYQPGDEIVTINGLPLTKLEKILAPVTPATNKAALARDLAANIFKMDTARTTVVTFKRNGKLFTKTVRRYTFSELTKGIREFDPIWKFINPNTIYVNAGMIQKADTLKKLFAGLTPQHTMILDMRIYPNYNVIQAMVNQLMDKKAMLGFDCNGSIDFPGVYIRRPSIYSPDTSAVNVFKGKLIVLVSEQTQSLGESIAATLRQRQNTIVAGAQTAGTTGNIAPIAVEGGISLRYTSVGFEGAGGSFRQSKGVKIDVPVKVTPEELRLGKDRILETALAL